MNITLTTNEDDISRCAGLMAVSEPWMNLQFDLEKCKTSLCGDYKEIYLASENGTFAGFVIIQFYGVLRGYIQTICIMPEFRNKGIGTALLKYSEERIWKMSPNVFICVSSFNHKAYALYKRLGYEKIGELKDHIVRGYDEYLLRKSKGPFSEFKPM